MNLAKISVNNPVAANILMVAIICLGIIALIDLPREFMPNINFNMAIIITTQPGVSSEEIEKLITIKLEDAVEDVDKIDFIFSRSSEGRSVLFLSFEDMSDNDFKFIVQDEFRLPMLNVVQLPPGVEDAPARRRLLDEYDIEVGGGLGVHGISL